MLAVHRYWRIDGPVKDLRASVEATGRGPLVDRSQHESEAEVVAPGDVLTVERSEAPIEIERSARRNKQHALRFAGGAPAGAFYGVRVTTQRDAETDFQFHHAKLLSNMTLEAWVFVDDEVAAGDQDWVVAARCNPDGTCVLWRLYITPQGALVFEVGPCLRAPRVEGLTHLSVRVAGAVVLVQVPPVNFCVRSSDKSVYFGDWKAVGVVVDWGGVNHEQVKFGAKVELFRNGVGVADEVLSLDETGTCAPDLT